MASRLSVGHVIMGVLLGVVRGARGGAWRGCEPCGLRKLADPCRLSRSQVGAHTALDLAEGACLSTARKMIASGQQHTRRVANRAVLLLALSGAGVSLAVSCAWTSHALGMLGTRFSFGEQQVSFSYRAVAVVLPAFMILGALLIAAGARRGPLGLVGLDQRYMDQSRLGSRKRSAAEKRRAGREMVTNWTAVMAELRSPYLVRVLTAGLLFGLAFMVMHLADYAGLRERVVVSFSLPTLMITVAAAWLVGCFVIFLVMHAHGRKNRIVASLVIGFIVTALHFVALQATNVRELPAGSAPTGQGEPTVNSRTTVVVVAVTASLLRFLIAGAVSTELA